MKTMLRDAQGPLLRAIQRLVRVEKGCSDDRARQSPRLIVETIISEDWASATFVGQRHRLELRLEGERGVVEDMRARIAHRIADAEVDVPGHIVADFQLIETLWSENAEAAIATLVCEALTIED